MNSGGGFGWGGWTNGWTDDEVIGTDIIKEQ